MVVSHKKDELQNEVWHLQEDKIRLQEEISNLNAKKMALESKNEVLSAKIAELQDALHDSSIGSVIRVTDENGTSHTIRAGSDSE